MKVLINLLPQERKDEFKKRIISRAVFKIGFIAILAELVLVAFSFACLKIIDIQKRTVETEVVKLSANKYYREVRLTQELIKEYSGNASQIDKGLSGQKPLAPLFEAINSLPGEGIRFENIRIEGKKVYIKGVGENRDMVIAFKNKLAEREEVAKVDAPISNFTKEKDIDFAFDIEIK